MPPLDTGSTAHTLRLVDPLNDRAAPAAGDFPTVGAYLRAVRERRSAGLAEFASSTRIRRDYLEAIENANYAALPSRPFAIGYVRSYAQALQVDGEAAAERYKAEAPDTSEPLRAPVGVKHDRPERRPLFLGAAAIIVAAVVTWNIAQRAMTVVKEPAAPAPIVAAPIEEPPTPQGPISLGAPTPPPAEQTTPVPYVTPGLVPTEPGIETPAPGTVVAGKIAPPPPAPTLAASAPVTFTPKGMVYGADPAGPAVVLQARKAGSLIVRGPGGEVYFARQLAEGESYRAPIGQKLSAEVTDPAAFSIYIDDQLQGALLVQQTALDKVAVDIVSQAPAE